MHVGFSFHGTDLQRCSGLEFQNLQDRSIGWEAKEDLMFEAKQFDLTVPSFSSKEASHSLVRPSINWIRHSHITNRNQLH